MSIENKHLLIYKLRVTTHQDETKSIAILRPGFNF